VILIIGILAAIAIPSFLNQKDKANDAAAKSYLRNMQTAEETYFTDNNTYTATIGDLRTLEPALNDVPNPGGTDPKAEAVSDIKRDYRVSATSKAGVTYSIARSSTGTTTRGCDRPNVGGCSATSTW